MEPNPTQTPANCVGHVVPCAPGSPEVIELDDSTPSSRLLFQKPKTRSNVYSLFTFNEKNNHWSCNSCRVAFVHSQKNGPSTLHNHLKRKHSRIYTAFKNEEISNEVKKAPLFHIKKAKHTEPLTEERFKDMLVKFVVKSNQPFTIVEEEDFNKLMSLITKNPDISQVPSAKVMKLWILDAYENEKKSIYNQLKIVNSRMSFCIDGWTSSNQHPFQGVIASWIDDNWKLCTGVLDLTVLEGSHTGENIAEAFINVLNQFDLLPKFLAIAGDNASNVDKACEVLEQSLKNEENPFCSNKHRIRCFAHVLNLTCQAILKNAAKIDEDDDENFEIQDQEEEGGSIHPWATLKKLRSCIVAIRGSPQRRQVFAKKCGIVQLDHKNLVQDVRTRWNSTYLMIERAIEMKDPLILTLSSFKELKKRTISDGEWEVLKKIMELLKPFRDATNIVSGSHTPTISEITSVYQILFEHLERFMNSETDESVKAAATKGWEKLTKYYLDCDGDALIIATVLDPRFKIQWYVEKKWKTCWLSNCRRVVKRVWMADYKPLEQVPEVNQTSTVEESGSLFNQERMFGTAGNTSMSKDELQRYLSEPRVHPDLVNVEPTSNGILAWWKIHQAEYPNLSKMARDYLAIPSTSVSVEILFSSGKDLLSHRRESMSAETIRMCMCLKSWFHMKESCL